MSDEKWVVIGRFGAPHGVKGWIKVHAFTEPAENLLDYQPWYIKKNQQSHANDEPVELTYEKAECHAKNMVVLLKDITDRNAIALYTNIDILMPRTALPELPDDEYYWSDLEGLTVVNQENIVLGRVDHLFETGSNDVLVIKGEREYLIPYLMGNTVLTVDTDKKTMSVDWDAEF